MIVRKFMLNIHPAMWVAVAFYIVLQTWISNGQRDLLLKDMEEESSILIKVAKHTITLKELSNTQI